MNPHDKIILDIDRNASHLEGDLFHYSFDSVHEYVKRNHEITTIAAASLYKKGEHSGLRLIVNPAWRFIKSYLLKKGFLDGYPGFIIAKNLAAQAYMKYKKLNMLNKKRDRDIEEPVTVSLTDK